MIWLIIRNHAFLNDTIALRRPVEQSIDFRKVSLKTTCITSILKGMIIGVYIASLEICLCRCFHSKIALVDTTP